MAFVNVSCSEKNRGKLWAFFFHVRCFYVSSNLKSRYLWTKKCIKTKFIRKDINMISQWSLLIWRFRMSILLICRFWMSILIDLHSHDSWQLHWSLGGWATRLRTLSVESYSISNACHHWLCHSGTLAIHQVYISTQNEIGEKNHNNLKSTSSLRQYTRSFIMDTLGNLHANTDRKTSS